MVVSWLDKVTPPSVVIPAQAGIQGHTHQRKLPWIPACAGMTIDCVEGLMMSLSNQEGRFYRSATP